MKTVSISLNDCNIWLNFQISSHKSDIYKKFICSRYNSFLSVLYLYSNAFTFDIYQTNKVYICFFHLIIILLSFNINRIYFCLG